MGFFANMLGKIWVKHMLKDTVPRYGQNKDRTFSQVVSDASETINRCNAEIKQNCDEIAELWVTDDVYTRMQVIKKECHGDTKLAWKVWWNIRYIEVKFATKRSDAHETVKEMMAKGTLLDQDWCYEQVDAMINAGEAPTHV